MKFCSVLLLLSLAALGRSQSEPLFCDASAISCQLDEPADTCCSPKYGLLVLVQQWVPGYGPKDEFTLHGLWPDQCNGQYAPQNGCDDSRKYDNVESIIKSMNETLYQRMDTYWPSYSGDNNWFWSHEWSKHGTCVSTIEPTCYGNTYRKYQDVIDYFEQVLDLRDKYDLYDTLRKYRIFPGNSYNVETIRDAIRKKYGVVAKLDCNSNGTISEISLNFYVQGRNKYIITDVFENGDCQGAVYYPKK